MACCQMATARGSPAAALAWTSRAPRSSSPAWRASRATALPEPKLLERRRRAFQPGAPVDDGVADLGQRAGAAQQATAVHHPCADAGRDRQVPHRVTRRACAEPGLADRCQVGVIGDADREAEVLGQAVGGQQVGPLRGQMGSPQQSARVVVDRPWKSDDGVRGRTVATLRGHGRDEVGQQRGDVGLCGCRDGSTEQDPTLVVHQGRAHLCPADIGGQDGLSHSGTLMSAIRVHPGT